MQNSIRRQGIVGISTLAIAIALAGLPTSSLAQESAETAADDEGLDVIVVTAQKRSEDMQDVPVSLQVLGGETLEQQGVQNFEDYVGLLPSVSFAGQGPGNTQVFMRGISSGGDGNKSGSSPSVAVYLDDQPVTAIGRVLDIHMYDIARVEASAGPQGTLYGAGSQAGTLRIITNQPTTDIFKGGIDISGSVTRKGDPSYSFEGFVNAPISDNAALRLAAWHIRDGGYIDNVPATFTFTAQNITVNNAPFVKEDFNIVEKTGARAALRIELDDNWSATAKLAHQRQKTNGVWDHDPDEVGDLQVERFFEDEGKDQWTQGALTIEGKVGGLELTYAGSYLDREVDYDVDYSAYSEYSAYIPYYTCYSTGSLNFSTCTDPRIQYRSDDTYKVMTHEFRVQNDQASRLRFIAGVFYQKVEHDYLNVWNIPSIPPSRSVNANAQLSGYPDDAYFITDQLRTEKELAGFGEISFDITDQLIATAGARIFKTKSSIEGAVGTLFSSRPLVDVSSSESGEVYKLNLSYKPTSDLLFYATYSEGFRPGGNNRTQTSNIPGVYKSDLITNYEIGWKTTLAGGDVRWNGSLFNMDWDDIQITRFDPSESFLGLTANVGKARSRGIETDIAAYLGGGFQITAAASYIDATLRTDYIRNLQTRRVDAPAGTRLPDVPKFKLAANARYEFKLGEANSYIQAGFQHVGNRYNDLFVARRRLQSSYEIVNLSAGYDADGWGVSLFVNNLFDTRAELNRNAATFDERITTNRPRTIGLRLNASF